MESQGLGGKDNGGPYLNWALLCERLLVEQDGANSFIRIIDRLTHTEQGPDAPEEMPRFTYSLTLSIGFRAGNALGTETLSIEVEKPSGLRQPLWRSLPMHLEGGERGAVFHAQMNDMPFEESGLYWFIVSLAGEFVTRVPLRVVYQRIE